MPLTYLETRVLQAIVDYVRRKNLPVGFHLAEQHLSKVIGTSRFPVNAALSHLANLKVVRYERNRGFFLAVQTSSLLEVAQRLSAAGEDPLYLKIAEYRLKAKLPDIVLETDLIRLFKVPRNTIRKTLSRIQQEGWIERRHGRGWIFLPMIDSEEAYEDAYVFRLSIEPAGLLSPKFKPNLPALEECRKEQEFIARNGYQSMTPIELFEVNARFHETLAACSGNPFILQAIRRLDQLRRLVEYMQYRQRPPRKAHAEEHLAILDSIVRGDCLSAAARLREHLDKARREKVSADIFLPSRS
jgi:DNA-binding GntR family transcriptional regulator